MNTTTNIPVSTVFRGLCNISGATNFNLALNHHKVSYYRIKYSETHVVHKNYKPPNLRETSGWSCAYVRL